MTSAEENHPALSYHESDLSSTSGADGSAESTRESELAWSGGERVVSEQAVLWDENRHPETARGNSFLWDYHTALDPSNNPPNQFWL